MNKTLCRKFEANIFLIIFCQRPNSTICSGAAVANILFAKVVVDSNLDCLLLIAYKQNVIHPF